MFIKFWRILLILSAWLSFLSFGVAEEVRIGILSEMTGPAAATGKRCLEGIELARQWLFPDGKLEQKEPPHHRLVLVFSDHQGQSKLGVAEFERIVQQERAQAVIITSDAVAVSISRSANVRQVPLLGVVDETAFLTDSAVTFRFYPSVESVAAALVEKLGEAGIKAADAKEKRFALVTAAKGRSLAIKAHLQELWRAQEGKALGEKSMLAFPLGNDPESYFTLAGQLKAYQPNEIVLLAEEALSPLIVQQLRKQGVQAPFLGELAEGELELVEAAETPLEGALFFTMNLAKKKFKERFFELYPKSYPTATAYGCYAALAGLVQAVTKSSGPVTSQTLLSALASLVEIKLLDESLPLRGREVHFDGIWREAQVPQP